MKSKVISSLFSDNVSVKKFIFNPGHAKEAVRAECFWPSDVYLLVPEEGDFGSNFTHV